MSEITVYAAADVIDVRIELGPSEESAEVERLVMRSLDAGLNEVGSLASAFGLSHRIMLDLLGDLWTAGRITVDLGMDREVIALSDEGRAYLADLNRRDSAQQTSTISKVLLEKLTGRILPERKGLYRVDRRYILPSMDDDRDPRRARIEELLAGVQRNLEEQGGDIQYMETRRITSARPAPRLENAVPSQRYVALQVKVWRDGDQLRVLVVDEDLGLRERGVATQRLQALVRSVPKTSFPSNLLRVADQQSELTRSTTDILDELREIVAAMPSAAATLRQSHHDRAMHTARLLSDQARALADREADVTLVTTEDEHLDAIRSLIDGAHVQVVIAVPSIGAVGIKAITDNLERAVQRGVRVVFIWGLTDTTAELSAPLKNSLYAIARLRQLGGGLTFGSTSASIHAKVVIADDRRALVTSKNFLSQSAFGEIGALMTATPGRPSPTIEELLGWAVAVHPDFDLSRNILRSADEFGGRSAPSTFTPPVLPQFTPALADPDATDTDLHMWASAWEAVAAEVAGKLTRERPVVEVLTDSLHHDLVREMLGEAHERFVASSHRVSSAVLLRDLASRAKATSLRGVPVDLVYGEIAKGTEPAELEELVTTGDLSHGTDLALLPGNHAKVIVADDTVVIGSFNYLSFNGIVRPGTSSEVSLRIVSVALADEVAALMGSRVPSLAPRELEASAVTSQDVETVRRIIELLSGGGRPHLTDLTDLAVSVGADVVVQQLQAAGASKETETLLSALVALGVEGDRPGWLAKLQSIAWARGEWTTALAFREALPDDARPSLTVSRAVSAAPETSAQILDGVVDDGEREALAAHVAAEYLTRGEPLLAAPLESWLPALAPETAALVRAALDHGGRFGGVDDEALRAERSILEARERLGSGWTELEEAVGHLQRADFRVKAGKRTLDFAFSAGEEYDLIAAIVRDRDVEALRDWFGAHESDDARWVDATAKRAGAPPIVAALREKFAARRGATRIAAATILSVDLGDGLLARALMDGELSSLQTIAELATTVRALARADDDPERRLQERSLRRLADITDPSTRGTDALGAWRIPRLLADTSVDNSARATLAARDLAEIRTPADAMRLALDESLDAAVLLLDELVSSRAVASGEKAELELAIQDERDRRAELVDAQLAQLEVMAERAGVDVPGTVLRLRRASVAVLSAPSASDAVEEARAALQALAQQREEEIRVLVRSTSMPPAAHAQVEELLSLGEYARAHEIAVSPEGTLVIEPPVPMKFEGGWPLKLIHRYLTTEAGRPASFDSFVPTEDDTAALRVVDAIGGLAAGDEGAEAEYLAAIQAMVDAEADPPRIEQTAFGARARFVLPGPHSTPVIWTHSPEITIAVGSSSASGLFRLATQIETDTEGAVLSIGDVLALLRIPDPGSRLDVRQRRLGRQIGSKLLYRDVLAPEALSEHAPPLNHLSLMRILYILGVNLERLERDALLAMVGTHPFVLWYTLDAVRSSSSGGRISFHDLRGTPEFDTILVEGLQKDLGAKASLVVLATLAEYGERDGATKEELREFIEGVVDDHADDATAVSGLAIVDLDAELERLVARRYVEVVDGRFHMAPGALWYAIRRTLRHDWFSDAVRQLVDSALEDGAREHDDALLMDMLHDLRGVVIEKGAQNSRIVRQGVEELRDPRVPVNVRGLFQVIEERFVRPEGVLLFCDAPVADIYINGSFVSVMLLMMNALDNGLQAIRRSAPTGDVLGSLTLSVREDNDVIRISARDTGGGFSDDVLRDFAEARDIASSHGDGKGRGLGSYLRFRKRGGSVTLGNDVVELDGETSRCGVVMFTFRKVKAPAQP